MDSVGTDDVLYVGDRERAARLASSLDDCSVRWVDSSGAAIALIEGERSFACVVADDADMVDDVENRTENVVCLLADDETFDTASQLDELAEEVRLAVDGSTGVPYPLPVNEEARLSELQPYLRETVLRGASFDRLASIAARLLEGSVGFVGLVSQHREHVVAASGEFPDSLPRSETVCTHAILDNGPLVVEDVAHDPRFSENGLLEQLGIRAYAGVPVRGRFGEIIGTLCVVDTIPRSFAPSDVELLADLGEEVADQFELRRRYADEEGNVA